MKITIEEKGIKKEVECACKSRWGEKGYHGQLLCQPINN